MLNTMNMCLRINIQMRYFERTLDILWQVNRLLGGAYDEGSINN